MVKLKNFLRSFFSWWAWVWIKRTLIAIAQIDIRSLVAYLLRFLLKSVKFIFQFKFIFCSFICSLCVFWSFWVTDSIMFYVRSWDYIVFFFYMFLLFLIFTDNLDKISKDFVIFFIWYHIFESIMDYFFVMHKLSAQVIVIEVTLTYVLYPVEVFVTFVIDCLKQAANFWVSSFKFHTSYVTVFYRPRLLAFIKFVLNCWVYIEVVVIPFIKSVLVFFLNLILPFDFGSFIKFLTKPTSLHIVVFWFLDFFGKLFFDTVVVLYYITSFVLSFIEFLISGLSLISKVFYYFFDSCDYLLELLRFANIYYHPYRWEMYKKLVEGQKKYEKLSSEEKSESSDEGE